MRASSPLDAEPAAAAGNLSYPQPLRLDVERYRAHLESLDLTEEQAAEVLQTLWGIAEAFVDEAFGVDSFSLARPQAGSVRQARAGGKTEAKRVSSRSSSTDTVSALRARSANRGR